jgi:hypothetical protein
MAVISHSALSARHGNRDRILPAIDKKKPRTQDPGLRYLDL